MSLSETSPTSASTNASTNLTRSLSSFFKTSALKKLKTSRQGSRKHLLLEYINEFQWRQKHKGEDFFYHFFEMVAKIYPVELRTPTQSEVDDVYEEVPNVAPNVVDNLENVVEGARVSLERVVVEDW